jgi:hypothetical protein
LRCAVHGASSCIPELKSWITSSEIRIERVVCQTRIGRTCSCSLVSTCPWLQWWPCRKQKLTV